MDPELKPDQLIQEDVVKNQQEEASESGDGMENVDRVGDTDAVTFQDEDGNDVQKKIRAGVNTDLSVMGHYAVHVNRETGEEEDLKESNGEYISTYSSSKADVNKWLNKKYEPKAPITRSRSGEAPKLEDIVTIGTGTVAKYMIGTPEKPSITPKMVPHSLFIDGVASQDDIRQGNLGDCYFLASLFQVIHYDPYFLPSIMHMHGDEVYTELCHREYDESKKCYHWVRKPIAVKWGENTKGFVEDDGKENLYHIGSYYRVKYQPEDQATYSAHFFNTDMLKITRTEYYQAALWVQCLERAYADYYTLYGQRGKGDMFDNCDRYSAISGGSGWYGLRILYGDDVESDNQLHDHDVAAESDKTSLMDATQGMVESMVTLAKMQDGSQADQMHMTTWAYNKDICPRIQFYADRLRKDVTEQAADKEGQTKTDLTTAAEDLKSIYDSAVAYLSAKKAGSSTEGSKSDEQKAIAKSMDEHERKLEANAAFKDLGLKDYISLKASMGSLISSAGNNMYIYTSHEYNIREVHFIDDSDKEINLDEMFVYYVDGVADPNYDPNANVEQPEEIQEAEPEEKKNFWQKLFGKKDKNKKNKDDKKKDPVVELKLDYEKLKSMVNIDKSYVVIQNPHAQSKAIYPGQNEAQSAVGTWTTSLRELFAGTSGYTAVIIKNGNHENVGKEDIKAVDGIGGTHKVEKAET